MWDIERVRLSGCDGRRVVLTCRRCRSRCLLPQVECIAVPGPLFMDSGFDRDRLRDSKAQQLLPPGNFLQFPMREDSSDLRKTPPLVRCVEPLLLAWVVLFAETDMLF